MKKSPFKLPESLLNQLREFTNGYYLVTVNEDMNFETYFEFPSQVVEEGIINHIDIEINDFQMQLRDNIQNRVEEMVEDEDEDEDLDGAED